MNSQDDQQPPMSLSDQNSVVEDAGGGSAGEAVTKEEAGDRQGNQEEAEDGEEADAEAVEEKEPEGAAEKYDRLPKETEDDYKKIGKEKKKVGESELESLFPESHAFKVENRLRGVINDLMKPVLTQRDQTSEEMKELRKKFQQFENTQEKIQSKLEDSELLREMFLEYEVKMRKMYNDHTAKTESMRKQLADTVQLARVHDDKMSRLYEEVKRMDISRGQMQEEIREFERLCQDINDDCRAVIEQIRTDFHDKLDDCKFKLDEQAYVSRDVKLQFRHQKELYQQLDGQLGWQKYNIDQLLKLTENLPVTYEQVAATETYLHKILPIKIQTEIYGNCKQLITKDKELQLDFFEYQDFIYEELIANKDRGQKFDKTQFSIPPYKHELKSLKLHALKEEYETDPDDSDRNRKGKKTPESSKSDDQAEPSALTSNQDAAEKEKALQKTTPMGQVQVYDLVDEIVNDNDLLRELAKGIELLGVFATADDLTNQMEDISKERESHLQDILNQIPDTIAAQRSQEKPEKQEEKETPKKEDSEVEEVVLEIPGRQSRQSAQSQKSQKQAKSPQQTPTTPEKNEHQHPEPIAEEPEETLTLQDKLKERQEYEAYKRMKAQKEREARNQIRKAQRELEAQKELEDLKRRRAQREREKQERASVERERRSKQSRTKLTDRSREIALDDNMRMGTIDSNKTRSPRLRREQLLDVQGSGTRRNEEGLGGQYGGKQLYNQIRQLQNQMRTVSKRLGLTYSISSDERDKEKEDGDENRSQTKEDDGESSDSQQLVTYGEFKKAISQLPELKKNMATFKSRLIDFERGLFGAAQSSEGSHQGEHTCVASLEEFHQNLKNIESRFIEKLDHAEMLKDQMKCDLKRLQRQHFGVTKDFDQQARRSAHAVEKVLEFNKRMILTDAALATIFKLLRIQYALCHQDERDKQNIFLAGFTEVGQAPAASGPISPERYNDDLMNASIREETATTSHREAGESKTDGLTMNPIDMPPMAGETPFNTDTNDQQSVDSKSNIQILYGVSKPEGSLRSAKKSENNVKKIKLKMVEGVKGSSGNKLLSFDAKCLQGCDSDGNGKNITNLMKAFKMACLSYKPSQVVFDQKSFDRSSLIEAQGYLLFLALEHMQHLDFDQVEQNLLGTSSACTIQDLDAELSAMAEENSIVHGLPKRSRNDTADDHFKSVDTDDRTTTINKSNSNEQLHTPSYFKKLDQLSNEKQNASKLTNQQEKIVNFAEYSGTLDNQIMIPNSIEGSLSQSISQTPQQQNASSRVATLKNVPSKDRLSRLINPNMQLLPNSGLISLSKSKQYARLASQVPTIFQIKDGQKYLNQSELVGPGLYGNLTPQDQYHKSLLDIQNLRIFQKHLKLQKQMKNRSHTSSKVIDHDPMAPTQHTQSTAQLQKTEQGIDELLRSARGQKGILYSSVNRLQKNQTAEPVEFGGLKSPSAIQFNFQSGPSLNAQQMIDEHKNVARYLGSAKLRNAACSQRKLTVVEPNANYFLKNQNIVNFQSQNAMTPQGRGVDPNSSRGKFAERFGLIGKDLIPGPTTEAKRLGQLGVSTWDNRTPSMDNFDRPPQDSAENANRFAECLSSRPLQVKKGGPLTAQGIANGFSTSNIQSKSFKQRLDAPVRIVIQPSPIVSGQGSLNPLRKILSIKTNNDGPVTQHNDANTDGPQRFRFSQGGNQTQGLGQRDSIMPSVQNSKIDPQQFSPRSIENNIL